VYHTIQFMVEFEATLEVSRKLPLERVRIRKGELLDAQLRPHVVETDDGPIEVADLFFVDGSVTRDVPFGSFTFVDAEDD
jgi:hypothetical protein